MNINEIDLRHLRGVVALAEELNFGRAAERLHLSQPPLTRLVAEVEKALGAALFARTTRRVSLTPVGEVFAAEARAVLARADDALRTVAEAAARQAGVLRLAYTPLALQTCLPPLLAALRTHDHEARVDLVELPGAAQQEALDAGRVDLVFSDGPLGGEYISVRLHREPLCLLVPQEHPLAAQVSASLGDLGGTPLILHARSDYPGYYDRVLAACASVSPMPCIVERQLGQNCLALAVGGGGVLLTPSGGHWAAGQGLRLVPLDPPLPFEAEVWAVWREGAASPRVSALRALILQARQGGEGRLPEAAQQKTKVAAGVAQGEQKAA